VPAPEAPAKVDPAPVAAVEPASTAGPAKVVEAAVPTTFDDCMTQGRAAAAKGDHARAKEMFDAAIKLDNKNPAPHIELARLYIAIHDKSLAVAEANKAVKLAPTSSMAWNTKGRAELNRFGYDDAIEAFTKAVELNQDNVWAWNNLGYTELQLKKYEDAVEHLSEATSRP
jgi:tetratricopeptide (TPR) repeat protein